MARKVYPGGSFHPYRAETLAAIERDKASPHCIECGGPMSKVLHEVYGHDTHICCGHPRTPVTDEELAAGRAMLADMAAAA